MRAQGITKPSKIPANVFARLVRRVTLKADTNGTVAAHFDDHAVSLGQLSAAAANLAAGLHKGLPLRSFASGSRKTDREIASLVRQLARHGLLEYRLARSPKANDLFVIEPQVPDYWPRMPALRGTDVVVLSRFAYLRRRGNEMVLESPRAGALFRIYDPKVATALLLLARPRKIGQLKALNASSGMELLGLLVDCGILFKIDASGGAGLRPDEGDADLVLWDFHDLLFHARSTQGRHANLLGGIFPYADFIPPLPAARPRWPGKKIDLRKFSATKARSISPLQRLLRERHSTRHFDDRRPVTIRELALLLDGTAHVVPKLKGKLPSADGRDLSVAHATRLYPSAGGSYELELYLAVDKCEGLPRGFYHYDAGAHALVPITVPANQLGALMHEARNAMAAPAPPQILIMIAARFGRVSRKYSSIAYALILKDVGVLTQTLYLTAAEVGLGACAIGPTHIDLFAKMTGIEFHVEGPVGAFAIGRKAEA